MAKSWTAGGNITTARTSMPSGGTLTAAVADLTNYKDASNVISCRVYQLAQ